MHPAIVHGTHRLCHLVDAPEIAVTIQDDQADGRVVHNGRQLLMGHILSLRHGERCAKGDLGCGCSTGKASKQWCCADENDSVCEWEGERLLNVNFSATDRCL